MTETPSRPVVIIRADASPAMGTGHVMRCLAVAEALEDKGVSTRFVTTLMPEPLAARLTAAGFPITRLDTPAGSPEDAEATRTLAGKGGTVLMDGYHFPAAYRAQLAEGGLPVAVFDDMADQPALHAALVINPAPGAESLPYSRIAPGAELALGPSYAPLRREVRQACARPRLPVTARQSLLLTFGGADPLGLTVACLERLAPALPDGVRLTTVVGPANPRAEACRAAAARHPGRVDLHYDPPAMGALMAQAGLAVAAAGGTTGELAALGVPSLLVVVAGNQESAAGTPARWCRVLDGRTFGTATAAARTIADTALALWADTGSRQTMAEAAAGLVDGNGAVRIAHRIIGLMPIKKFL